MAFRYYVFILLLLGQQIAKAQTSGDSLQLAESDSVLIITEDTLEQPRENMPVMASPTDDFLDLNIVLPDYQGWNQVNEGELLAFKIYANGGKDPHYIFDLVEGREAGIQMDTAGNFSWTPSFDLADRLNEQVKFPVIFEVRNDSNQTARKKVEFIIQHVNRPPEMSDLKNFYVQYNVENAYQIDLNAIKDPDNDPVIFKPIPAQMPEGADLTEKGLFTWKPSLRQFNRLKEDPIALNFIVEDQPSKAQIKGSFNILVTQMDLPPEITMIPKNEVITTKENETVNFKFFLSDPNGDEDITQFNLISEDLRITDELLVQNSKTQWEFIWTPGYDFVKDVEDSVKISINFYTVDKTYLRDEKSTTITVVNTENQEKIDRMLYAQYRGALIRVWDLLEQLKEKEEEFYKRLKKAKKGKVSLAVTDASLGAVTALSPVFLEGDEQKIVTGVGGTTVLTMGTLEAADVIAKSPSEIIQKLNKVIEKRNELLMHGNVFARRYSTTLTRRDKDFTRDTEQLLSRLIMKEVATLELTAGWENPKKARDNDLRRSFPDFVENEEL
ncbi:MAG: hypothetical protein ACNS62_18580 [Candidatus Cyclobacteriaceae bacterium M3_2C_046]